MDDYSISSLQDSRNEWCSRLINIFTPLVIEGFKSIFDESWKLCQENDETDKYLMTFQNFLARIPKWNSTIVEQEASRIVDRSGCGYLTDLISCVHIIQLKSLTCMRVGTKQKKIDISVPSLNDFIHKVYINGARKIYTNIYLFEKNISPLQIQKNRRELEMIIREEVLNTIRENVPVEQILKVYLDETVEDDIEVEEKEEIISTEPIIEEEEKVDNEVKDPYVIEKELEIKPLVHEEHTKESIQFKDIDEAISVDNVISEVVAPKTEERLEQISTERNLARKLEEMEDEDEDERLKIGAKIKLSELDVHDLEQPKTLNKTPIGLEEIEILT